MSNWKVLLISLTISSVSAISGSDETRVCRGDGPKPGMYKRCVPRGQRCPGEHEEPSLATLRCSEGQKCCAYWKCNRNDIGGICQALPCDPGFSDVKVQGSAIEIRCPLPGDGLCCTSKCITSGGMCRPRSEGCPLSYIETREDPNEPELPFVCQGGMICCLPGLPTQTIDNVESPGISWGNPDVLCGVAPSGERIVGGTATEPGSYPWMAAMIHIPTGQMYCGGSVISDRHILTAEHCFDDGRISISDYSVVLNEHDLSQPDETLKETYSIIRKVAHPDYNKTSLENDLAILTLDRPIRIKATILPICIPPENESFSHSLATVTGWGRIAFFGRASDVLQQVTIPVWSNPDCVEVYPSFRDGRNTNLYLCAGKREGGQDSCRGDSGGPLVFRSSSGRWIQIGIVSFGTGCGDRNSPGVYTRVSKYVQFLRENTNNSIAQYDTAYPIDIRNVVRRF